MHSKLIGYHFELSKLPTKILAKTGVYFVLFSKLTDSYHAYWQTRCSLANIKLKLLKYPKIHTNVYIFETDTFTIKQPNVTNGNVNENQSGIVIRSISFKLN